MMFKPSESLAAASAIAMLVTTVVPLPAHAGTTEWGHSYYAINDVEYRIKSPFTWSDSGSNPSGTWIKLFDCHFRDTWAGNPEPTLRLMKHVSSWPDQKKGDRTFSTCAVGSSQNWGNQDAGSYHFDVIRFDVSVPTQTLHVGSTRVDW